MSIQESKSDLQKNHTLSTSAEIAIAPKLDNVQNREITETILPPKVVHRTLTWSSVVAELFQLLNAHGTLIWPTMPAILSSWLKETFMIPWIPI
ncbi:hypothetical protein JTB14_006938 [Gonioctena quinquepunctata]|nr:hypothetical protein JTB14_006938 [Gonioctena quinquepunctata]